MKILNKNQCERFINLAVERLADYPKENRLRGVTTGISGGIDSAVVGVIGIQSIKRLNRLGYRAGFRYLFLDCESSTDDYQKAKILSDQFKFKLNKLDLTPWFKLSPLVKILKKNHPQYRRALGNIKARLRMIALYQEALLNNYIYLSTGDLSEYWMGFWTRHGDEGDVEIIQSITKTEVYDLGEFLGVPKIILNSQPADGLMVTPTGLAQEQLKLPYLYIDYIMSKFIGNRFDYNGDLNQLNQPRFKRLIKTVSQEIKKPEKQIKFILCQALKTAYKRRYGYYSARLITNRKEIGFLEIGSHAFNQHYLKIIAMRDRMT